MKNQELDFDNITPEQARQILEENGYNIKSIKSNIDKYGGIVGRGLVKAAGAPFDLLALPYNLTAKSPISVGEDLASVYDYLTENKFKPETLGENITQAIPEYLAGGAGLSKIAGKAGGKASKIIKKFLTPKNAMDYASLGAAGVGTEVGKALLPENEIVGGLAGGLTAAAIPGLTKVGAHNIAELFRASPGERLRRLGNFTEIPEKGQFAEKIASALQNKSKVEKGPAIEKYNKAKEQVGQIPIENVKEFAPKVSDILDEEGFTRSVSPKTHAHLRAFKQLFNKTEKNGEKIIGVTFNGLEKWREGLNRTIRSLSKTEGNSQDVAGLKALKTEFDNFQNQSIESGLAENKAALTGYQEARKEYANWASKYKNTNSKDIGKKFISDVINNPNELTPEHITDMLFGSSQGGFDKKTPYIIQELKKLVPEEFESVRQEGLSKLLRPVLDKTNIDKSDVRKVQNNLNKALKEHPSTMRSLYGTEGVNKIKKISNSFGSNKEPNALFKQIEKIPIIGDLSIDALRSFENSGTYAASVAKESIKNKPNNQEELEIDFDNLSPEQAKQILLEYGIEHVAETERKVPRINIRPDR